MLPAEKRRADSAPPSPQRAKAIRTDEQTSPVSDPGGVDHPAAAPSVAPCHREDGEEEEEEASVRPAEAGQCAGGERQLAELTSPEGSEAHRQAGTSTPDSWEGPPPAIAGPSVNVASPKPESHPTAQGGPELDAGQGPGEGALTPPRGAASDNEKDEGERELIITIEEGGSETKRLRRKKGMKRRRKAKETKSSAAAGPECDIQLDDSFERALEDGAKQHNLTAVNVRNILHEVITNEHVVAMMKAAINDTEQQHMFEPKMTRSKLKEVVEKGVVPPTWNISPMKKEKESKAPLFIDIPLEEEDSSDEEYKPEEEEEDETAEESFLESDNEGAICSPSTGRRPKLTQDVPEVLEVVEGASPVEGRVGQRACFHPADPGNIEQHTQNAGGTQQQPHEEEKVEGSSPAVRHLSVEVMPMGPPPLPPAPKLMASKDSTFMKKLYTVDEELALNETCLDSYQSFDESLIASRTRSKWPLTNVPLGLLEAELKAPDITADMYEPGAQEDVYWQSWMKAVMNDLDFEDDEDDPEYNFLEDLDEPDMEDFRNDRAVQITKKEVNELMEELFETFQDEMGVPDVEEEVPEDDIKEQVLSTFNTPQALRFEEPLANILTEQHRTVKAQIEQLRQRKAKRQATATEAKGAAGSSQEPETLSLDPVQKLQLQQQMQQHVQLLCQVHLLTSICEGLRQEADMTKLFLNELASFAEKASEIHSAKVAGFRSSFSTCNLKEGLSLVEEFEQHVRPHVEAPPPKEEAKINRKCDESSYLPRELAWILATRGVFMYPELLPHVALQPRQPKDKASFTKGEDNLLALGLKHFEDTDFPKPLISQYLMPPKTYHQLTVHIKNLSVSRAPDNVVKLFRKRKVLPPMPSRITAVPPGDMRPPIQRGSSRLPYWLQRSLPVIRKWMEQRGAGGSQEGARGSLEGAGGSQEGEGGSREGAGGSLEGAGGSREVVEGNQEGPDWSSGFPLLIPEGVLLQLRPRITHLSRQDLRRRRHRTPAVKPPVPIHPAPAKASPRQAGPFLPARQPAIRPRPRLIQPAPAPSSTLHPAQPAPPSSSSPSSSRRRPWGRRASALAARPTPPIPRAPVLLAVPAGVKLLSLGAGCNVIQSSVTAGYPGQTLQVATVVVGPAAFPCGLSQPPAPTVANPQTTEAVGNQSAEALDPSRVFEGPWGSPVASTPTAAPSIPEEQTDRPSASHPHDGEEKPRAESPPRPVPSFGEPEGRPLILDLGQELDVGAPPDNAAMESSAEGGQPFASPPELARAEEEEEEDEEVGRGEEEEEEGEDGEEEEEEERLPEKSDDTLSAGESSVNPQDGKSQSDKATKVGLEEEEDDDFDDLTQDEEDEEVLSSASEESALSVPELQETMEKLTWLASKQHQDQEGDSEEENSQEENTEPEEEEEEEEGEGLELLQKEGDQAAGEAALSESNGSPLCSTGRDVHPSSRLPGQEAKLPGRGRAGCRSRARRGRRRVSKDSSKLLLLYDEDILSNDPLRQQKDMAFAQAYLTKVREALQDVPGKYEEFLRILYDFETNWDQRTVVDLYGDLCEIIQDWPQLLKDFAAFLLPEQALQCGLFEEQQAFDKSRKFLRQLEICFAENPSQLQKVIKALQNCAVCSPPDVAELKVQVWQLLKGHHHLQDEFSLFFDQLRPPASRLNDFEEVNWTEDKEYEFDGFEEVVLPDLEEEEELQKMAPPPRSKRRREGHSHEKALEHKAKGKDSVSTSVPDDWSPQPALKDSGKGGDAVEEDQERREEMRVASSGERRSAPTTGWSWEPSNSEEGRSPEETCSPASEGEEGPSEGSPPLPREKELSSALGSCVSVKFASAGARVRYRNCQEMALAQKALRDGCSQGLGETEGPAPASASVCAKNTCVNSIGERVVLWTREADRAILTACQEKGANQETFSLVAQRLIGKSAQEVSQRFRELMRLFHTSGDTSTDEEDDTLANSNPEQQADWLISDEDQD
ncbi:GON-4-like protein isoform X1 [Hypanus sabinus]|uniref:GON-4-like protein isoform X1 n=1 Tax=Hypanus sabinus TaxID=79690 RepID=UPI0028C4C3FB|nr:GON-4-like protein isoform X1 [Hypanus sabinus]XP_059836041.1 GON-4-like protein isoform X1 [Hypanus sabinus]